MSKRLSDGQLALQRAVSEVLHYLWDPIGVAGCVHARDEYDGYADHVFSLLCQRVKAPVIADYLVSLEVGGMGIDANRQRAAEVAEKLLEWRDALIS